jgi:hypothetical protein
MKDALSSLISGGKPEDVGSATPPYEQDFELAGEDDMGGEEGGLLTEVQGMLATASPDQLQQVKDILSGGKGPGESAPPMPEGGDDMGMPM